VGGVGGLVWVKIKAKVNMPGNTREKERRARMKSFFSRERELFVVQPLNKVVNDGLPERNL
jgi:hypothetical protein